MIALVIVYPEAVFFHAYLPYEEKNGHKRQKEGKTRRNNRLPGSVKTKPAQQDLYF
ncbi:hypothetical protein [Pantoea sp. Lij88]|uniref:hypothetical protein n=1 Tax=Pantoea sp. Lij88 TaxID=3028622 RepID=UPI0024BB5D4D|nr:hypothetical protein [Pantoea sp. Lij88]WHQ74967.1 hypothetical protein PU624_19560 [Pantoea sp. Lij88]